METRLSFRESATINVTVEISKKPEQDIILVDGNRFKARAFNISETGIGLTIKKYLLPKGLIINMLIDGAPFGFKKPLNVKGEVRYCRYTDYKVYKCGVKFMSISTKNKKAIAKFISACEKRKKTRLELSE